MPKTCGERVNILRSTVRKSGARLSTMAQQTLAKPAANRAQPWFIQYFIPTFTQEFSIAKFSFSPLIEHYFYPVSTGPINNCNQMKFKER